jgi:hypothetical protein
VLQGAEKKEDLMQVELMRYEIRSSSPLVMRRIFCMPQSIRDPFVVRQILLWVQRRADFMRVTGNWPASELFYRLDLSFRTLCSLSLGLRLKAKSYARVDQSTCANINQKSEQRCCVAAQS